MNNLAVKLDTEMPLNRVERPILANNLLANKHDKVAKYVWKTGKSFFLSKRQSIVVDTYIATRNVSECRRVLLREMNGKAGSLMTIWRLLRKDFIKVHIAERMEELGIYAGWTKERWFKVMTDHLRVNAIWEQAKEDLRFYGSILEKKPGDVDAKAGELAARQRQLGAAKMRLAPGDLYAMNLIGKYKNWGIDGGNGMFNQTINITQLDGRS